MHANSANPGSICSWRTGVCREACTDKITRVINQASDSCIKCQRDCRLRNPPGFNRQQAQINRLDHLLLNKVPRDALKQATELIDAARRAMGVSFVFAGHHNKLEQANQRCDELANLRVLMDDLRKIPGMEHLHNNQLMDMYTVIIGRAGGGQKSRKKCKARRRKHSRRKHKGTKRRRTHRR